MIKVTKFVHSCLLVETPVHDWQWHDEAREKSYQLFEDHLGRQGIIFHKMETRQPVEIDVPAGPAV